MIYGWSRTVVFAPQQAILFVGLVDASYSKKCCRNFFYIDILAFPIDLNVISSANRDFYYYFCGDGLMVVDG